jgi:ADP-ribose pyrophosphatase
MNEQLLSSQRKMLALIQSGLSFTKDPFDKDRYQKLEQILLQQIADNSNENLQVLTDIIANDHGYITPKVDVRAFIRKNNKFLLVQDIKTKTWALPGGFADVGYSPSENIIREVKEETGLNVEVNGLLNIFDTDKRKDIPQLFQYYKMIFSCKLLSGHFKPNIEVNHIDYFDLNDLPALSIKRTTREQLQTLITKNATIQIE